MGHMLLYESEVEQVVIVASMHAGVWAPDAGLCFAVLSEMLP